MKKTLWKGALSIAILGFLSMPPTASAAERKVGFIQRLLQVVIQKDGGQVIPNGIVSGRPTTTQTDRRPEPLQK